MRLDLYLFEKGFVKSRTESKGLIISGAVTVNGTVINKPSFDIEENIINDISVDRSSCKFVSRGGHKLEAALDAFGINVFERHAIDIGASSGGFTDCLLKRGAKLVVAIDSGKDQLSPELRVDDRVISIEGYNARNLLSADLPFEPDLCVMDVSFISATLIMPSVYSVLSSESDFVCLIKPQFEVGKSNVGKGGIVKDQKVRENAVSRVVSFAQTIGFEFSGLIESPIKGGDGNTEYLAHFIKQ